MRKCIHVVAHTISKILTADDSGEAPASNLGKLSLHGVGLSLHNSAKTGSKKLSQHSFFSRWITWKVCQVWSPCNNNDSLFLEPPTICIPYIRLEQNICTIYAY